MSYNTGIVWCTFAVGCIAIGVHFTIHPTNQTATFGELVNFECRVSSCDHTLTFLINGQTLEYLNSIAPDSVVYIREGVVTCEQDQYVGTLSIIVNNKTLEIVNYISCNVTIFEDGGVRDISSNEAYIVNITNPYQLEPQCPQCPAATGCVNFMNPIPGNAAHKEQLPLLVAETILAYVLFVCLSSV